MEEENAVLKVRLVVQKEGVEEVVSLMVSE